MLLLKKKEKVIVKEKEKEKEKEKIKVFSPALCPLMYHSMLSWRGLGWD